MVLPSSSVVGREEFLPHMVETGFREVPHEEAPRK